MKTSRQIQITVVIITAFLLILLITKGIYTYTLSNKKLHIMTSVLENISPSELNASLAVHAQIIKDQEIINEIKFTDGRIPIATYVSGPLVICVYDKLPHFRIAKVEFRHSN